MARQLFDVKSLLLTVFKLLTTVVFLLVDLELKMKQSKIEHLYESTYSLLMNLRIKKLFEKKFKR
jgi:hypothetical protein